MTHTRHRPAHGAAWIFSLALLALLAPNASASEDLSTEQLRMLAPRVLQYHLTQPQLDGPLMRKAVDKFLERLDPAHTLYLKDEVAAYQNLTDEKCDELAKKIKAGDITYFSDWIKEFKEKQLARDTKFFEGVPAEKEKITRKVDKKERQEIEYKTFPVSEDERRQRLFMLLNSNYHLYTEYLTEQEAFDFAIQTVQRTRVDWREFDIEKKVPTAILKAIMNALDPHSEYMDADDVMQFESSMAREFFGIGVQIRGCPLGAQVEKVIKGGPAEKSAKFETQDQIIAVDGHAVASQTLSEIVKLIKGERGTPVKLTLKKAAKDKEGNSKIETVTLIRDRIELSELRVKGKLFESANGPVGHISVQNFYQGVSGDVADRIAELSAEKPLKGLVLDLRNNSGGLLNEAVALAGLFITEGPVVAERNLREKTSWREDNDESIIFDGPMVVLVNQFSASASEIVAGALKDYGRAVVVGPTQTHGKGTVQRVINLALIGIPGRLKITVQQYFVAGGDSVQLDGVTPDIAIPGSKLLEDFLERGYKGAIPHARIESGIKADHPDLLKYSSWKKAALEKLTAQSKERVAANKDFDPIRKALAEAKKEEEAKARAAAGDDDTAAEGTPPTGEAMASNDKPVPEVPDVPEVADDDKKEEDKKDPQLDEAVGIVSDSISLWNMGLDTAKTK